MLHHLSALPNWGLRDYGVGGQLGLEPTPEEYVANMVEVFREVRRVLRDDGTLWLNLGDSYGAGAGGRGDRESAIGRSDGTSGRPSQKHDGQRIKRELGAGLKPKDLVGIPWRVAFALQADGWVLRSDIVWSKPNPMPESVTDRPTKAHEMLFLFSKAKWIGPEGGQFSRISDDDARWLALLFDAEGNIVIKRAQREDGRLQYGAQIAFANTCRPLLERAAGIVGAGSLHERKGTNAPMFYWQLAGRQARDLLYRIYPFLIVKPRQARVAVHMQDVIAEPGRKRPNRERLPEYAAFLEKCWLTVKSLNRFGSPDLAWVPEVKYGRWDSQPYFYDAEAVKETTGGRERFGNSRVLTHADRNDCERRDMTPNYSRNRRTVWHIATQPYSGAHFATMPEALVEPCVLAGSPKGGIVLDPFAGSGTVVKVARKLGRTGIGIDISDTYLRENAKARTGSVQAEFR